MHPKGHKGPEPELSLPLQFTAEAVNWKVTTTKGEDSMRFYTQQHRYTCGIDLHARSLYVCILDDTGQRSFTKTSKPRPRHYLN